MTDMNKFINCAYMYTVNYISIIISELLKSYFTWTLYELDISLRRAFGTGPDSLSKGELTA